eukprot:TRINITY_DN26303_c0_g1_i1.p1 TRINITY_DN26303_c0_g1~~TRINITY_DN26303_c0_g1_i1.p1  ORF type:complete len:251 (+),score=33.17 TRINITY_DN26303_c0_g1_i1:24-776(+)
MEAGDGESRSRRTVWLGQEFVDEGTMSDVKNVVRASVVLAALQLLSMLLAWRGRFGHLGSALVNFVLGMILPACGYFGATQSSSGMMLCFCSSNLVSLLCQGLILVILLGALFAINSNRDILCEASCVTMTCGNYSEVCSCQVGCNSDPEVDSGFLPCCVDFGDFCVNPREEDASPMSCQEFESDFEQASNTFSLALLVTMVPATCLSTYAWYHGMQLWRRLSAGEQFVVASESTAALHPSGTDQEAVAE